MNNKVNPEIFTEFNRLHESAAKSVLQQISNDEQVRVVVVGDFLNYVIATEKRVFVYKRGWMGGLPFDERLTFWSYRNITGITMETGGFGCRVAIEAPGFNATAKYWSPAGSGVTPLESTNAIQIGNRTYYEKNARLAVAKIRELMELAHGKISHPSPNTLPDHLKEPEKLGEIKEREVIPQKEDLKVNPELFTQFKRLHESAAKSVLQQISDDEQVHVVIIGSFHNYIIATEKRVFIYKYIWTNGLPSGERLTSWSYHNTAGITMEMRVFSCRIAVEVPGSETTDKTGSGVETVTSTSAILVSPTDYKKAKLGVDKIRELMELARGKNSHPSPDTLPDYLKEREKLGEIKEKEVIPQKEDSKVNPELFTQFKRLHESAAKSVLQQISDDEQVHVVIIGSFHNYIIATEKRVFIYKYTRTNGLPSGERLTSWSYHNIAGITMKKRSIPSLSGWIVIEVPGFAGGGVYPARGANAIPMDSRSDYQRAKLGVDKIRELMELAHGKIPHLGTEFKRLHESAAKSVLQQMSDDEQVHVVIIGASHNYVIATEKRVFIYKRGLLSGLAFNERLASWSYRNITGVIMERSIADCWAVAIEVPGSEAIPKYWSPAGSGGVAPVESTNAILVSPTDYKKVKLGVDKIRELMELAHGKTSHPSPDTLPDHLKEPEKLGEVRGREVIPQSEKITEIKEKEIIPQKVSNKAMGQPEGWIYVLSYGDDLHILKIGRTTQPVKRRVSQINSGTGVLVPWMLQKTYPVRNLNAVESKIHSILWKYRIRERKEFFDISLTDADTKIKNYLAKTDQGAKPPQKQGCFIATAIYQNPLHPQVEKIRNFRDTQLTNHLYGRMFIAIYNSIGPHLAKPIERSDFLRSILRTCIDRI